MSQDLLISELECGVDDVAECSETGVTQQEIRTMRVFFRMNCTQIHLHFD